jgi:hypothetical protein
MQKRDLHHLTGVRGQGSGVMNRHQVTSNEPDVWAYPVLSRYYSAMATFVSSEVNLPYFLCRAADSLSKTAMHLAEHNKGDLVSN